MGRMVIFTRSLPLSAMIVISYSGKSEAKCPAEASTSCRLFAFCIIGAILTFGVKDALGGCRHCQRRSRFYAPSRLTAFLIQHIQRYVKHKPLIYLVYICSLADTALPLDLMPRIARLAIQRRHEVGSVVRR
jgi:hypothetical protein